MVTNQPDYSRGNNIKKNIIEINNYLKTIICLDQIVSLLLFSPVSFMLISFLGSEFKN